MRYYIDLENGRGDGKTPETPKGEYRDLPVKAGDIIMFKCGSVAFDILETVSGTVDKPVVYTSYGDGAKPVFHGSVDVSNPSDWTQTEENIWECRREIPKEACNFIFNGGEFCGIMVWEENELSSQGEWTDSRIGTTEGRTEEKMQKLLMYSHGNPGIVYKRIECVARKSHSLAQLKSNVVIDGLCFKNNGVHALEGAGENIIVKNCDISFIGGCVWSKKLRIKFGNGVEFWNISKNIWVENNTFCDIYDSGVTHQGDENCQITENVHFDNNLFVKCGMGAYECRDLIPINTTFNNNICIDAGEGFSKNGVVMPRKSEIWPQPMGHHVFIWRVDKSEKGGRLEIKNNLFYNAPYGAAIYSIAAKEAEKQFCIDRNIYYTKNMQLVNRIFGKNYKSFSEYQKETGFDKNGKELK